MRILQTFLNCGKMLLTVNRIELTIYRENKLLMLSGIKIRIEK